MGVLYFGLDPHCSRNWTAPTDNGLKLRRWMDRDAVRFHVARNADVLAGGIGDEVRRFGFAPAFDEIIAGSALEGIGEIALDFQRVAGADAEIVEPGAQGISVHAMLLRELNDIEFALRRAGLSSSGQ